MGTEEGKHGAGPALEKDALVKLYEATAGNHWDYNRGWMDGEPCPCRMERGYPHGRTCSQIIPGVWAGVTCDENGSVMEMMLGDNKMHGTLPTQLGRLSGLSYLGANTNSLSG